MPLEVPRVAYVNPDGWISVFPGEKINIEFDLVDGKYVNPHYVEKVVNKWRTMTIKFSQDKALSMLNRRHGIVGNRWKEREVPGVRAVLRAQRMARTRSLAAEGRLR